MKDNLKKIFIGIGALLILMYISVYIMSLTGYYTTIESKNNTLTTEAINRFEKDILNGEKIVATNYLEKKETYDNLLSRLGISIGNVIEKLFDKAIKLILNEIEGAIK